MHCICMLMTFGSLINGGGSFPTSAVFAPLFLFMSGAGLCHSWLNSTCFNPSFYLTREGLKFRNSHPPFPPLCKVLQTRICLERSDWTCARNLWPLGWSLSSQLMLNECSDSHGHRTEKHICTLFQEIQVTVPDFRLYWKPMMLV